MYKKIFLSFALIFVLSNVHAGAVSLDVSFTPNSNENINIAGRINVSVLASPTDELTILVHPQQTTAISENDILYINRFAGSKSFSIAVPNSDTGKAFIVKIGSENSPAQSTTVYASAVQSPLSEDVPKKVIIILPPEPITKPMGTTISKLGLPTTLDVVYDGSGDVSTKIAVQWSPNNFSNSAGTYYFTAIIDSDIKLAEGVRLPELTVTLYSRSNDGGGGGGGGGGGSGNDNQIAPISSNDDKTPANSAATITRTTNLSFKIGDMFFTLNNKKINMDVPIILNDTEDRTLFPMRFISQAMGYEVVWDEENECVTISSGEKVIILHIGSDVMYINNSKTQMNTKAVLQNSRTYIPLRYVAEAFDFDVGWDESAETVRMQKTTVEVLAP